MSLIKSEPEEENEIKFDIDLYQKPSQDFVHRQHSEWTIKQEPEEENQIKIDPDFNQEASQNFDQSMQTELTMKQEPGSGYVNSTFHEVTLH